MSRYLILFLLNIPFIVAAIVQAVVNYKMRKISKSRFRAQMALWLTVGIGLATAQAIYNFLFSNNLTQTEPLSLFDVIQITGIVVVLSLASRAHQKLETLERRVQDLHQELSIRLSQDK